MVRSFLENCVSQRLRDDVRWREECCSGEVAETIAAYANEADADLVILSTRPPRWWLPFAPATVRTVECRARGDVIVIRSGTDPRQATRPSPARPWF